jgi:hypothetical protein
MEISTSNDRMGNLLCNSPLAITTIALANGTTQQPAHAVPVGETRYTVIRMAGLPAAYHQSSSRLRQASQN